MAAVAMQPATTVSSHCKQHRLIVKRRPAGSTNCSKNESHESWWDLWRIPQLPGCIPPELLWNRIEITYQCDTGVVRSTITVSPYVWLATGQLINWVTRWYSRMNLQIIERITGWSAPYYLSQASNRQNRARRSERLMVKNSRRIKLCL